jgi:hypothetical protein
VLVTGIVRWRLLVAARRDFFEVTMDSPASINRRVRGGEAGGSLSSIGADERWVVATAATAAIHRMSCEDVAYRFRPKMPHEPSYAPSNSPEPRDR